MDGSFTVKKLKTEDLFFFTGDVAFGRDGDIEFKVWEDGLARLIETFGNWSDLGDGLYSDCVELEATVTSDVFVDIIDTGSRIAGEDGQVAGIR